MPLPLPLPLPITCLRPAALLRCAALLLCAASARGETTETLFFLADDLLSGATYFSNRLDDVSDPRYLFEKNFDRNLVLYARPENYVWQDTTHEGKRYNELRFPNTASYAYLRREAEPKEFLERLTPTSYRVNVSGSQCLANGCTVDETIVSVVMPKRFRVTNYKASTRGHWKIVDGTYSFYARNVKGAEVTLEFEDRYAAMFNSVSSQMASLQGVEVSNVEGTIRIVMPMDNVFAPGGVTMQPEGARWVKSLAAALSGKAVREVRIEGHADNTPIKSAQFPSNWELSAGRAAQALRVFLAEGFAPSVLMAAGLADSRPRAEGNSPEARAKNRRIEFTVVPALQ